jgi:hypothetical protein
MGAHEVATARLQCDSFVWDCGIGLHQCVQRREGGKESDHLCNEGPRNHYNHGALSDNVGGSFRQSVIRSP